MPLLIKVDNCLEINDNFEKPIDEKKLKLNLVFDFFSFNGINFLFFSSF